LLADEGCGKSGKNDLVKHSGCQQRRIKYLPNCLVFYSGSLCEPAGCNLPTMNLVSYLEHVRSGASIQPDLQLALSTGLVGLSRYLSGGIVFIEAASSPSKTACLTDLGYFLTAQFPLSSLAWLHCLGGPNLAS
jgi:hypothetical protein